MTSPAEVTWHQTLKPTEVEAVEALLARGAAADGHAPLSEHGRLHLRATADSGQQHAVARMSGRIVGYGFLGADATAEMLVDPGVRRQGIGAALLEAMQQQAGPRLRLWAHGDLPAAQALAASAGMRPVRRLCRYVRSLEDLPDRGLPEGYALRTFTRADADDWLELNAAAFVDLPDQGGWTEADLALRLAQPWFDPQGFLLAFDEQGLAGAHWTKVHDDAEPIGEVYVLAVAERARGTGLASALTIAGLQYLRDRGLARVMLFADSSNTAAVHLYTRLGFTAAACDVQYGFPTD